MRKIDNQKYVDVILDSLRKIEEAGDIVITTTTPTWIAKSITHSLSEAFLGEAEEIEAIIGRDIPYLQKETFQFAISWDAPIVPGASLAGVPIGISKKSLDLVLSRYMVGSNEYRFSRGPLLNLESYFDDESGDGILYFHLSDRSVISRFKREMPALSLMFREGRLCAIKAYDFSFQGDMAEPLIYQGRLPGDIGLGNLVVDLLNFTELEYDDNEQWFYTDEKFGVMEVTGWDAPIDYRPDQRIYALCIIG